ncbi:hypothetical protein ACMXYR_13075 [Neptuniibacter sp. QD29_5]|uniref:hypothetical protein n=1 Tax=Neptuniibacter sp. QD29_5 TaxID=3398207 RepID=UPI0039F46D07
MKKIILIVLSIAFLPVNVVAETTSSSSGYVAANVGAGSGVIVMRDPFSEPQMVQKGNGQGVIGGIVDRFGQGFRRTPGEVNVPKLLFKGYIDRGDNSPMALLQIAGNRVHLVKEGDEINVNPANPRQAIRITKISRLSITVETGTLGQMKVLR